MNKIASFEQLQKSSSDSFHQQKKLIKQVLLGKTILCAVCRKPLQVKQDNTLKQFHIYCDKKCTSILLDQE
jgi:hypothetical protein